MGDIVGYKQQHIFQELGGCKAHANMRIDEVAKLYGPGLANEINPATGKTYATSAGWKPIEPGDVCWEDVNQDGTINSLDKSVLGNISQMLQVDSLPRLPIRTYHSMHVSIMLLDIRSIII